MDKSHLAKSEEKTETVGRTLQRPCRGREIVASEGVSQARVVGTQKGEDVIEVNPEV